MKRIIVAYDKNYGIGADNDLLWKRDLPADLKHFKDLTVGTSLVMGRKTFESIGRALPGRENIVISSTDIAIDGIKTVRGLDEAYDLATHETISVIGGGQIYNLALDTVDEIVATEVQATFPQADIFFPAINTSKWHEKEASRKHHDADDRNKYPFDFVTYTRLQ